MIDGRPGVDQRRPRPISEGVTHDRHVLKRVMLPPWSSSVSCVAAATDAKHLSAIPPDHFKVVKHTVGVESICDMCDRNQQLTST